jgi:hypothetical protein
MRWGGFMLVSLLYNILDIGFANNLWNMFLFLSHSCKVVNVFDVVLTCTCIKHTGAPCTLHFHFTHPSLNECYVNVCSHTDCSVHWIKHSLFQRRLRAPNDLNTFLYVYIPLFPPCVWVVCNLVAIKYRSHIYALLLKLVLGLDFYGQLFLVLFLCHAY